MRCHDLSLRFVMRLSDSSWHEECLFCSQCHSPLVNSCYYRDGKLFCRVDYERSVENVARIITRFSNKKSANKMHSRRQIFNFRESFDMKSYPAPLSHLQTRIVSTHGAGSELLLVNLNFK